MKYVLYTGHSALIVALLVAFGTLVAMGATEIVGVTQIVPDKGSYIEVLIKTVPALFILGAVVYLFIKYLEQRDKELRLLLNRTIDALNDNSKALNELRMDHRRRPHE